MGDVVGSTEGLGRVGSGGSKGRIEGNGNEVDEIESSDEESDDGASQDGALVEEDGSDHDDITGELRREEGNEEEQEPAPPDRLNEVRDSGEEEDRDGTDEEEEGSADEEEDDEEEEPTLKYARLGGSAGGILEKDSASALLVSNKYIVRRILSQPEFKSRRADDKRRQQVLGSHNGAVYVLNLEGRLLKTFRPHAAMVNDLSLDLQSDFVASASMDGKYRNDSQILDSLS